MHTVAALCNARGGFQLSRLCQSRIAIIGVQLAKLMHYRKSVSKDKIKRVKPLSIKHYCIFVRLWLKTKVRGA